MEAAFQQLVRAVAAESGWTVESDRPSGPRAGRPAGPDADLELVFDGGAIGNPGRGYGSFAYKGRVVRWPTTVRFPGLTTNNQAEYQTLIAGLRAVLHDLTALEIDPSSLTIEIRSDSELLVNQLTGRWKLKDAILRGLHEQARDLLDEFNRWNLEWHSRTESVRILGH